jgi:hypothetical protein
MQGAGARTAHGLVADLVAVVVLGHFVRREFPDEVCDVRFQGQQVADGVKYTPARWRCRG